MKLIRNARSWAMISATLGLTAFLVSASITAAHAASVASTPKYLGAYGGHSFSTTSYMDDMGSGYTWQSVSATGGDAPTGWIGVQAKQYLQNGVLCNSSSTVYNPSPVLNYTASTTGNCGLDYHYSMGRGGFYTGSNYSWATGNPSPYLLLP